MTSKDRILVVDDNPDNIQVLADFLEDEYRVLYATSGRKALEIFRDKGCWQSLMKNAMSADFSWERSARGYLDIYSDLVRKPLHS